MLHAARRASGGGSAHDDRVVRARLAQAFGRLIRRQGDRGMFVLLSAATPTRLLAAFPPGVAIARVTLDQAIARVAGHGQQGVEGAVDLCRDPAQAVIENGFGHPWKPHPQRSGESKGWVPATAPSGPATIRSIRACAASSRAWQCLRSASPRS